MLAPVLFFAMQASAAADALAPITAYNGAWTITSSQTMAGPGKPDHLVNHCTLTEAFYACEQVVNGKAMALVVFTPAGQPGQFHTQTVLPDGHATGRGDLTIAGGHWTFSSKAVSDDGKTTTYYRTENLFTGRDRIHFESFQSTDGANWQKKMEGDDVRAPRP